MATGKHSPEELKIKLLKARALKKVVKENVEKVLQYLEEEERELGKSELELKNVTIIRDFTDNLLAEKDKQLLEKESIIAEKDQNISQIEGKLADAEIKLIRNSQLINENKQDFEKQELQVKQLKLQIERTAELHAKQLDDKNSRIDELENIIFARSQKVVEAAMYNEHEFGVNKDDEIKELRKLVDEQEWHVIRQQKQLKLAEIELTMNAEQIEKLQSELRKTEKELLTSKQLANETMIREMKQLDLSDELKSILSNLTKDAAKIAEELHHKHYSSTHNGSTGNTAAETKNGEETIEDLGEPDHLRRLRTIYPELIERFDAKKLVGWMFAAFAIGLPELESLLGCRTACEAAEGLLEIILKERSESIFECFLTALNKTNQQHIASWILYSDYDIDSEHVQLIQRHHVFLVDKIDSLHSGLLDELFAREVIDLRDLEQLKAEKTQTSRNETLLSVLGRKSAQHIKDFVVSLTASGQGHVVERLVVSSQSDSSDIAYCSPLLSSESSVSVEYQQLETKSDTFSERLKDALGLNVSQRKCLRDNAQLLFTLDEPPTVRYGDPREVAGITMFHSCLYVVYWQYNRVEVFDCKDGCKKVEDIEVEGLMEPWDMVGSTVTSQLFITQHNSDVIIRVDSNTRFSTPFVTTGYDGTRLLSLVENRLLVTSRELLLMFDIFSGKRMKKIPLTESIKGHKMYHAIESNRYTFFLSHGLFGINNTVSEIDSEGREIRVFDNKRQRHCFYLALDSVGRLLLTDVKTHNNEVVILNEQLEYERILIDNKQLDYREPTRLHYDKNNNILIVGLINGQAKMFEY